MTTKVDLDIKDNPKLVELREKVAAKVKAATDVFDQAGDDMDFSKVTKYGSSDSAANLKSWQQDQKELDELNDDYTEMVALFTSKAKAKALGDKFTEPDPKKAMKHDDPRKGPEGKEGQKTLGELFTESKGYNGTINGPIVELDIDLADVRREKYMKTVFQTGAGWDPQDIRIPRVILDAQAPAPVIADAVPVFPTNQSAVVYMEETTFTNNAAEVAESTATTASDLFGEAALALTERTSTVRKIAVFLPVSDEQMEDIDGVRAYVDQRLSFMIDQRLDLQIVAGDGIAPNLEGTFNVTGINTQALGGDSRPDAIYKAADLVRDTGRANPSVVLSDPTDWQPIRLLTTADGIYIFGSPMEAGTLRIWGMPVVTSTQVTTNSQIVGDYANFSGLFIKRGIDIQVSNSHSSYFTRGMQAIRADFRAALVHFRPAAFTEVTGL